MAEGTAAATWGRSKTLRVDQPQRAHTHRHTHTHTHREESPVHLMAMAVRKETTAKLRPRSTHTLFGNEVAHSVSLQVDKNVNERSTRTCIRGSGKLASLLFRISCTVSLSFKLVRFLVATPSVPNYSSWF